MHADKKTGRRLTRGILVIILLAICLCVTSYALVMATVRVEQNFFQTGTVKLDLNGGAPVIQADLFEPGATLKKDFYLKNESTDSVYYKLYFNNVAGGLANVIQVTVTERVDDGIRPEQVPAEKIVYSGVASQLTKANLTAAEDDLEIGETRYFSIFFHFPAAAGNSAQDMTLAFDLCAEAVQTRNNPDKLFE